MKRLITILLSLLCAVAAFSQSAEQITKILSSSELTYGEASYLAATALGLISDDAGFGEAIRTAESEKMLKGTHTADEKINVRDFAYLCATAWGINDSLFFWRTHTKRYALKELKADGIIPASYKPERHLTGQEALAIVTRCLDRTPEDYGNTNIEEEEE